jgi:lipopolysaccharide/colanic/teichoic acid biosynthesis glycosyltransferase
MDAGDVSPQTSPSHFVAADGVPVPTIWGLSPVEVHDHFWAARGVSVVRLGQKGELPTGAELFLLTDTRTLAVFRLSPLLETLSWVQPDVMFVRLATLNEVSYREVIQTGTNGRFDRFQRLYSTGTRQAARLALTRDREIAAVWQAQQDARRAWHDLRHQARSSCREIATTRGRVYSTESPDELARMVRDIQRLWSRPSSTIGTLAAPTTGVWAHPSSTIASDAKFIGPAWVGAGRAVEPGQTVLGPAVLWDDPANRPVLPPVAWSQLEPLGPIGAQSKPINPSAVRMPPGKRLFDIAAALVALICTLPIYPLVMLAIWIEDGRPFFFSHRRQTIGGREFGCIKFRSMRKDAEKIKAQLNATNRADGPQFFFVNDPRMTRVGRVIRKTNIDELPQFINVLLGDMSIVGPRPSPSSENQYNPTWREARLSVRAGITGLWQVRRTRRPGLDFQEWIKYDIEYVRQMSWRLDILIILQTVRILLKGGTQ